MRIRPTTFTSVFREIPIVIAVTPQDDHGYLEMRRDPITRVHDHPAFPPRASFNAVFDKHGVPDSPLHE